MAWLLQQKKPSHCCRIRQRCVPADGSAIAACVHPLFQAKICSLAGVAQLVEQRIRNAKVGSSTLFTGTRLQRPPPGGLFAAPHMTAPHVRRHGTTPIHGWEWMGARTTAGRARRSRHGFSRPPCSRPRDLPVPGHQDAARTQAHDPRPIAPTMWTTMIFRIVIDG